MNATARVFKRFGRGRQKRGQRHTRSHAHTCVRARLPSEQSALEVSELALLAEALAAHPVGAPRPPRAGRPPRPPRPTRAPRAAPTRRTCGAAAAGASAAALL